MSNSNLADHKKLEEKLVMLYKKSLVLMFLLSAVLLLGSRNQTLEELKQDIQLENLTNKQSINEVNQLNTQEKDLVSLISKIYYESGHLFAVSSSLFLPQMKAMKKI